MRKRIVAERLMQMNAVRNILMNSVSALMERFSSSLAACSMAFRCWSTLGLYSLFNRFVVENSIE